MKTNPFPLDVATGSAFCNRKEERERMFANIQSNTHTLVSAPRRYGKTSLVAQVLNELNRKRHPVVCIHIDFLLAGTPNSAQTYLLSAVADGLAKLLPIRKQAIQNLGKLFKSLKTNIAIGSSGVSLEIESHQKPEMGISEALTTLDDVAGQQNKSVVVFMDEFQQLGELKNHAVLEAAIRHSAQYARHTTYIFTGSNRHLLGMMFNDSARPLYHMCDRLTLHRISESDYRLFIQRAAKKRWDKALSETALAKLLELSQRHPYYVNVLCNQLWNQATPASKKAITSAWQAYLVIERHRVSREINALSNLQRELLTCLALAPTAHPRSHEYLVNTTVKSGSVTQLIDKLMALDLIYVDEEGIYRLVDPVINAIIRNISSR